MTTDRPRSDSGAFRIPAFTPEAAALQAALSGMYLTQDPAEIVRLLADAARAHLSARAARVFIADAEGGYAGADPELLPEKTVLDFVSREAKPLTVPQGSRWLSVLPLRAGARAVGLLVLDVTGRVEDVTPLLLEPLSILTDQAAVLLSNAQAVRRSIGESALLANILDSITNAIVTLDLEGRITRLNRNAMAVLELTPDAVGRPYADAFPAEVAATVRTLLDETSRVGFAMERMVTPKIGTGLELNVAVSLSPLRDETYALLGSIVVLRDMTASRELERLRKIDTMKSEFVANVSHELKTPLTSIKAYTEALIDMTADEQQKSFLKVIDEESDRLLYLINDLLNVSRIQSGKMKMHFAPCRPRSVVDEVLGVSKIQSDRHEIVVESAADLPEMLLDKEKLKEVLINLLSNAIKYSPKGGKVWVRLAADGGNLRIEFQDQGMRIPTEHQPKLFQAFSRVDSSATAEIPGTGLGLVIVKAIVEHHGGRIAFESTPGAGTTFLILLPIRQELKRTDVAQDMGSMAEG